MHSLRSLLITTAHHNLAGTTDNIGVWLEDFAAAYFILKDGAEYITVVSPAGGQIPIDPNSQHPESATENIQRFLACKTMVLPKDGEPGLKIKRP